MKVKLKENVVLRIESDDYAILYNSDTGESFVIDPVAVFISRRLNGIDDSAEIADKIGNDFEGVPENTEKFVINYMESLIKNNLAEKC